MRISSVEKLDNTDQERNFFFVAGYTCLDFVNTQIVRDGQPEDLLTNFNDLVVWSVAAGFVDRAQAKTLSKYQSARKGRDAFAEGLQLRSGLRSMVEHIINGQEIDESIVRMINEAQRSYKGYEELQKIDDHFEKRTNRVVNKPAHLLVPIAQSATDLLCNADLSLIRKCENPSCVLYFYDTTKNHARRWCSMNSCGNRMKVAAYYKRAKQAESE